MKKVVTLLCILFLLGLGAQSALAQLLTEDFNYTAGTALTADTWTQTGTSTTNPITVSTSALSLTGTIPYPLNGSSKAVLMNNTGQDVHKQFTAGTDSITSGPVYASFLVNVSAVGTTNTSVGDYFFHFGDGVLGAGFSTFDFWGRTYVRASGNPGPNNLTFGVSKAAVAGTTGFWPSFTDSTYSLNTTYLLVVKYELITGAGNSQVSLYVFKAGDDWTTEPGSATAGPTSDGLTEAASLAYLCLRQGTGSTVTPTLRIEGIHVATTWSALPLPVELTAFNANVSGKNVDLTWKTATEINNSGFAVERKSTVSPWSQVGFVAGNGTTNASHNYSYVDAVSAGTYSYRLKQIDHDGKFAYSQTAEAAVGLTPADYTLGQNYPNPFNPTTMITFAVKTDQKASMKVYNMLGQEVMTLFDGDAKADQLYHVQFNASSLSSGTYFYILQTGDTRQVKKMVLLK